MFAAVAVLAVAGCGEDLGGAPDVSGLPLPEAKQELERAGFRSAVTSDAAFGVVVEENFTVCDQESPKSKLVPLEVSKQC